MAAKFEWVSLSQISGSAGTYSLSISVTSANTSHLDRVKVFSVLSPDGKERTTLTVTQKAKDKAFNLTFNPQQFH